MTLIVHIGFAKAGTTFLQRRLFPNLANCNYIGRTYDADGGRIDDLSELVAAVNGHEGADINAARHNLRSRMIDGVNIISHENLLRSRETAASAARLADITRGFDTRILITIRRQEDIIWSRYVHDRDRLKHVLPPYSLEQAVVPSGQCGWPVCRPDKPYCACARERAKIIPLDFYDYGRVYDMYARQFGRQNVHVIALESFNAPQTFFAQMEDLIGMRISGAVRNTINPGDRENMGIASLHLESEKRRVLPRLNLMARFLASNLALDKKLDLGLERYGYIPHAPQRSYDKSALIGLGATQWPQAAFGPG